MIGGTSTGGLVAILLGRLRIDIDECMEEYKRLSTKFFTTVKRKFTVGVRDVSLQDRFDTEVLERALKDIIQRRTNDEDELLKESTDTTVCNVFVCAVSKSIRSTVIFSNHFSKRRGNARLKTTKSWEAARATSAATKFFESIAFNVRSETFTPFHVYEHLYHVMPNSLCYNGEEINAGAERMYKLYVQASR